MMLHIQRSPSDLESSVAKRAIWTTVAVWPREAGVTLALLPAWRAPSEPCERRRRPRISRD